MSEPLARKDMGLWMISLERAEGRRTQMHDRLTSLGLSYTWFKGVDGAARMAEFSQNYDAEAFARNMGQHIRPGKVGCFQSHIAVWRALLESDHKVALIVEDDIVFHDDFLAALDTGLAAAAHWDTLRFNAIRAKLPVCQGRVGAYHINAYIGPFTGNGAYLITRDVATRLLGGLQVQTRALDHELNRFFFHDFRQRGLEPFASHPDDGGVSTIDGAGFAAVKKLPRRQRLPHYRLKAANYFRRLWYLIRTGAVPGSKKPLI